MLERFNWALLIKAFEMQTSLLRRGHLFNSMQWTIYINLVFFTYLIKTTAALALYSIKRKVEFCSILNFFIACFFETRLQLFWHTTLHSKNLLIYRKQKRVFLNKQSITANCELPSIVFIVLICSRNPWCKSKKTWIYHFLLLCIFVKFKQRL